MPLLDAGFLQGLNPQTPYAAGNAQIAEQFRQRMMPLQLQQQQAVAQSAQDQLNNQRRANAFNLLASLGNLPGEKQQATYETLKPVLARMAPDMQFPDEYDPLTAKVLQMSTIPAEQMLQLQAKQWGMTKDAFGNPIAYNLRNPSETTPIGADPLLGNMGQQPTNIPAQDTLGGPQPTPASGQSPPAQGGDANQMPVTQLQGVDLLKRLPPQIAAQVKALDEGHMPFPGGFALKSPYWQRMMTLVSQYDPAFDAVNYNARYSTRKAFTSGPEGRQINALNTAIGHLGQLDSEIDNLHNTGFTPYNEAANWLQSTVNANGNTAQALASFDATKKSVADEVTRVWRGTGGSEADIKERLQELGSSKSPAQLRAALSSIGGLLESKINALNDQYTRGMGIAASDTQFVSPHAQEMLKQIRGNVPQGNTPQTQGASKGKANVAPDGTIVHDGNGNVLIKRNGQWVKP